MMTSEVGFDFGVLTRILNEAKKESLPIEWVAAAEMDEKKFRFDENGEDLKVKARKRQPTAPQCLRVLIETRSWRN